MKTCVSCGANKPLAEYRVRNKKTGTLHNSCGECHAKYRRQHYLDNRQKYLDKARRTNSKTKQRNRAYIVDWLKSHPCVDCGETDIEILQFDHVEPLLGRGGRIHDHQTISIARLQQEIAKCEIRCANCHLRRTRRMQGWSYET